MYGGAPGSTDYGEFGGSGTAFIYHLEHEHRTLIVDNNGNDHPYDMSEQAHPYIDWDDTDR